MASSGLPGQQDTFGLKDCTKQLSRVVFPLGSASTAASETQVAEYKLQKWIDVGRGAQHWTYIDSSIGFMIQGGTSVQ